MDIDTIIEDFEDRMKKALEDEEEWEPVRAEDYRERLGLDPRAYVKTWAEKTGDRLVTYGDTRPLEYYGGFEYVDKENVQRFGDYTVWDWMAG